MTKWTNVRRLVRDGESPPSVWDAVVKNINASKYPGLHVLDIVTGASIINQLGLADIRIQGVGSYEF